MPKKKGGKKGGGKKGGKAGGKKAAARGPTNFVPVGRYVRPETPPPKNTLLPAEVKAAAASGDFETVREWIEDENGDIDARWWDVPETARIPPAIPEQGWTMLMAAAAAASEQTLIYLLDMGASVDLQDNDGETALMLASKSRLCGFGFHDRSDRIVLTLLKAGASLTLSNKAGRNAGWAVPPHLLGQQPLSHATHLPTKLPTRLLLGACELGAPRPSPADRSVHKADAKPAAVTRDDDMLSRRPPPPPRYLDRGKIRA